MVGLSTFQKVVERTRYYLLKCGLNACFFFNYYGKIKFSNYEGKALYLIVGDVRALRLQNTEAGSIKPGKVSGAKAFNLLCSLRSKGKVVRTVVVLRITAVIL